MPQEEDILRQILRQLKEAQNSNQRDNWSRTFFAEDIVTEKRYQIGLSASVPLSGQRDIQSTANGGSITDNDSHYLIDAGNSANGSASLETVDRTLYVPGSVLGWGLGVRPLSMPTDTALARFGLFQNDAGSITGMYYRLDADGLWAVVRDDPTNLFKEFQQSQWNMEQLDGQGNGLLDILAGNMFRGKFGYYGYTPFQHAIGQTFTNDYGLQYDAVPVNMYKRDGAISISTPNLPIRIEVDGGANGEQLQLEIGGRQAVRYGGNNAPFRNITGLRRAVSVSSGTFYPIVAFKSKTGWEDVRKFINKVEIDSDQSGAWRLVETAPSDGTLDTPPLGYSADEVGTQFNVTATSIGSGETIASGLFSGGFFSSNDQEETIGRAMKENQDYTLEVDPDANATISASVRIKEYF